MPSSPKPLSPKLSSVIHRPSEAAKRAARPRKPLVDAELVTALMPSETLIQSTGPTEAAFFDGRLPLGFLDMPLDRLVPRQGQPRTEFDEAELAELAATFTAERGILEPILCRPVAGRGVYEIIAGERRFRAARMAGLATVPVIAREVSDEQAELDALIENLHRKDLSAFEEARALQRLVPRFDSAAALAAQLGWDRQRLSNKLRILKLEAAVLDRVQQSPQRYSWRLLNTALQVQEQHGVDAALAYLAAPEAPASPASSTDPGEAGQGQAGQGQGKPAGRSQAAQGPQALAFAARATRQGGLRLSLHAPTRHELPQAVARLRAVLAALEAQAADPTARALDLGSLAGPDSATASDSPGAQAADQAAAHA